MAARFGDRGHGEVDEMNRTQTCLSSHSGKVRRKPSPDLLKDTEHTARLWWQQSSRRLLTAVWTDGPLVYVTHRWSWKSEREKHFVIEGGWRRRVGRSFSLISFCDQEPSLVTRAFWA